MSDEPWPVDRLVRGWWSWHELMAGDRETRMRVLRREDAEGREAADAYDAVTDAIQAGGPQAVELLRALAGTATDEDRVIVAAVAVQDLLIEHGTELVASVVDVASHDERFAEVLRATWVIDESLDEEVHGLLKPWMPLLHDEAVRRPARGRPKGRRWKERGAPGAGRGNGE